MLDLAIDPAGLAGLAAPAAHTTVSWLGTYFVHSTVLIGGVWMFSRFLPLDALTRSLLWKMSLVGGLFTATLQTGLGVEPMFGRVTVAASSPAAVAPRTAPPPPVIEEEPAPLLVPFTRACVGCESHVVVVSDDDVTAVFASPPLFVDAPGWAVAPTPALAPTTAPTLEPAPMQIATAGPMGGVSAAVWAFAGLFVFGAAASLGRLGVSFSRLRGRLRGRRLLGSGPLRERLTRLLAHARLPGHSVALSMSEDIGSPIALAGREIVVPEHARELAPRQQDAMLAHELAHVLRRDPAWQMLAAFVESLLFFQPLNRVARRGMQEAAEELCDDWAVRHTGSELHLARCLSEVAAWPGHRDMSAFASPMAGHASQLVRRVQRLLDVHLRDRGLWARRWRVALGAALLAMVTFGAPGLSIAAEAHGAPEWPTTPDNGPQPTPSFVHVPEAPMVVVRTAHNHAVHGHDIIVVEHPQELTRKPPAAELPNGRVLPRGRVVRAADRSSPVRAW
ncbi:M56 family metallopeptidase [Nannocystis exedens]|uniref:M56 family metallopeptidase n=1 Tax=Nannocystis exedens TaxID=54 RepID=UPI000BBA0D99|nr:M56 family metallopeptidase [Nannocystis exedens]PCC74630.1 BlaR1 peptidase M56 [Nannocystis exedens]